MGAILHVLCHHLITACLPTLGCELHGSWAHICLAHLCVLCTWHSTGTETLLHCNLLEERLFEGTSVCPHRLSTPHADPWGGFLCFSCPPFCSFALKTPLIMGQAEKEVKLLQ